MFADWVNTVSPTYAKEIRTPAFGGGMEGVLTERRDRLSGIMNGVDYASWDPATDPYIAKQYTIDTVWEGKEVCKADLQRSFGLPQEPRIPLLGMVARLVEQKGVDLVTKAADDFLKLPVQLVILGEGDPAYHARLHAIRERYPDRVGLQIGYDEGLAHKVEAGSDLFLMPSLFEPSGLNQLYSLSARHPAVVRTTGSRRLDSGHDGGIAGDRANRPGSIPGYTAHALFGTVRWATHLYHERPVTFRRIVRNGMKADWSWDRAAADYEKIYHQLVAEREGIRIAEFV